MATIWILLLIFSTSAYCGPLRELDGNLPMIDNEKHPLYVDIDVSKFNKKLKDFLTKDIPREISDVFERYIGSSEYIDLVNNRTEQAVRNLSEVTMNEIKRLNDQIEDLKKSTPETCDDMRGTSKQSGTYLINGSLNAYCDLTTDGGGWTVIQRRMDGKLSFSRSWKEYKAGFGDVNKEFWLGNDKIHKLTKEGIHELYIYLERSPNNYRYAKYSTFAIGDEQSQYRLRIGGYTGTAGDSLDKTLVGGQVNGQKFSTGDQRDRHGCASYARGGWWYKKCFDANLNQSYERINWDSWSGRITKTIMMIRKR